MSDDIDALKEKMVKCGVHKLTDDELWDESAKTNRLLYPCEFGIDRCDLCARNSGKSDNYDTAINVIKEGVDARALRFFVDVLLALGVVMSGLLIISLLFW